MNNVQAARAARDQINSLAPAVMSSIVSPVGVSPTKFVSGILDDTENAWHLCRFVHCIKPDKVYDDPDSERLREEMHARLPALHNSLRESRDHIGHTLMLGEPVEQGSSGERNRDPVDGYSAPKCYARDKWIYSQIHRMSYDTLSQKLREKAKAEKWPIISSRNGLKKAADRYASFHNMASRRFKGS